MKIDNEVPQVRCSIRSFIIILKLILLVISFSANAQRYHSASRMIVIKTVPPQATLVVKSGINYRYLNGIYYKPYHTGFVVISPPIGIRVTVLPTGFVTVYAEGTAYFFAHNTYYVQKSPNVFEVVTKPSVLTASVVSTPVIKDQIIVSLPQGTDIVTINNHRYYKFGGTYYEKIILENGEDAYKIVGSSKSVGQ